MKKQSLKKGILCLVPELGDKANVLLCMNNSVGLASFAVSGRRSQQNADHVIGRFRCHLFFAN